MKIMKKIKKNKIMVIILTCLVIGGGMFIYFDPLELFTSITSTTDPKDLMYNLEFSVGGMTIGDVDFESSAVHITVDDVAAILVYEGSNSYRFKSEQAYAWNATDITVIIAIDAGTFTTRTLNWDIWDDIHLNLNDYTIVDKTNLVQIIIYAVPVVS